LELNSKLIIARLPELFPIARYKNLDAYIDSLRMVAGTSVQSQTSVCLPLTDPGHSTTSRGFSGRHRL
jgi:hypothetical protein